MYSLGRATGYIWSRDRLGTISEVAFISVDLRLAWSSDEVY